MLGWLIGSLALPTLAHAICCDQPSPQMNANLVCTKNATACVIGPQTIDGPPGCTQPGCDLDFGARPVTFDGAFSVGSGTLKVRALTITINKAIAANGAFAVDLAATGTTCANGVGDLVVRQAIDVSSANAGSIRLTAGCRIGIESTGQLNGNCSTDSSSGGTIDVIAGTSIVQAGTIRATGSGNDGGSVSLRAGDDVQVQKTIDVRSNGDGEGGTITLRAGDPTLTGAAPGGALTVSADLIADGSTDSDGEFGEDGGGITLQASGPVLVTSTAMIRANGGQPDGGGGSLLLLTQELPAGVLTALDGDASLQGPIVMRGAGNGSGGELDGTIGRGLQLAGTVDLSGGGEDSSAGNLVVTTGGDLRVEGPLSLNGRVAASTGGFVDLRAGFAASTATLTVARTIDVSAGSGSDAGDLRLAGCNLAVQPNVLLDARSSLVSFRPAITLAADEALTLGAGSRCLAPPSSATLLVHTATTTVSTAGTTFNPPAVTTIVPPQRSPLPPCPVCGDGIRAPGEPCDPGAGADGACCSNDCLVRVCPTPTHSPTPTVQPTGETPTPTPTVTRTATVTPSPTATVTPGLPPIAPRAVLGCERTLAKGTSRLVTTELAFLENCSLDTLGCLAAGVADPTTCLARVSRRCQSRFTKLVRARQKFDAAFTKRCAGDPPALPFALVRAPDVLAFANLDATCAEDVGLALTSPSAVRACVARAACAGEHALGIAVPHLGTLLARVFDASSAELCFAPGSQDSTPVDVQPSRVAVRCQRAIVTAGRKLLVKQLAVAARCVDSLLGCRLAGGTPSSCAALTEACRRKLAAFQDTTDGTRARLAATIVHACGAVPADQIVLPAGLGFANVGPACLGVGEPAPRDATTIAPCLATVYACASGAIVRRALPLVDGELARVGLALGEHFTCPTVAPSATPTVTPTGATATPTPTPTATPTPTTAPVTLLIPGGGTGTSDCVAEWTVVGRPSDPPSLTTVECVDGDPACDLDGKPDDLCHFAVGVCFANADPQLPECSGVGGLTAYTLQSPQPAASNPIDASNAAALIAVLTDLFGVPPGGLGQNRYTFDPPLVLTAPTNCTAPTSLTVERRGLALRSERIRARAIAGAAGGNVLDDGDNLLLTCVAPGSQPF